MIIPERAGAIVDVGGCIHLVLPFVGRDPPATLMPDPMPFTVTAIVAVMEGITEDFRWCLLLQPGGLPLPADRAGDAARNGIAAAMGARLFGLALGTGSMLGQEIIPCRTRRYLPPQQIWWDGDWTVTTDLSGGDDTMTAPKFHAREDANTENCRARLVLHGEVVLR